MKKQTLFGRIIAVALVALMIMSILPITAAAAPTGYQSGDLLLQMDALDTGRVTYAYDGVTVTNYGAYLNMKKDSADPTKVVTTKKDTGTGAGGIGIKTNLPLTKETTYTIAYRAKVNAEVAMFFGFGQNANYPYYGADLIFGTNENSDGVYEIHTHNKWWSDIYKNSDGTIYGWTLSDLWTRNVDSEGFALFVITIENGWMSVSVGGVQVPRKWNLNDRKNTNDAIAFDSFNPKELWIETGFATSFSKGVDPYAVPEVGVCVFELKDISIYSGKVDVNPFETGDLLLAMSSLDASAVKSNPFSLTVANISQNTSTAAKDTTNTQKINRTTGTEASVAIKTDLAMHTGTAYTVDFKLKPGDINQNIGLLFGLNTNSAYPFFGSTMVVYPSAGKVSTNCKWQADAYKNENTGTYGAISLGYLPWSTVADEDGFVDCTFTFDGRYMSLSIAGVNIGTRYDLTSPKGTDNAHYEDADNFDANTLNLQAGFTSKGASNVNTAEGDTILEIKDIAIYSGVRTQVQARDEDGNVVATKTVWTGAREALPTVGVPAVEASEGKELVVLNGKNYVEDASALTFKRDAVVTVKEVGASYSDIIGAQIGVADAENKTNKVRFIGGLYNTDGENVGFDILVTYKDADGNIVKDKYRRVGNTVYSSISATVDGEIKNYTAAELGAKHLYALVFEGVPTEGQVDFKIVSFRTIDGERVYGEVSEYSVIDGVLGATVTPLA